VVQDYDWRSLIAYAKDHGGYKGCSYQIETDSEIDEYDFFKPLPQFLFLGYGTVFYKLRYVDEKATVHCKRQQQKDMYIKNTKTLYSLYQISQRRFSSLTVTED
jgi:hypothetical protein